MAITADTTLGQLAGTEDDGAIVFRGVPFAKPPVGPLRWRQPEPMDPWVGTRDATEFGASAVQRALPGDVGDLIGIPAQTISEDCLYLNIWTPALDDAKRPVMVWIHGGGNVVGSGTQPRIDGRQLALSGDVVVVTLNYRMGAFGFLHAPVLGAYGNEGLLDQIAALFWVRNEIGSFGGNPADVTVFGQSAGGFDIAHLMAMPSAAGAFDKAIPMSGSLISTIRKEEARAVTEKFMLQFRAVDDPERLRGVSADDLLDYQVELTGGGLGGARFGPTADGYSLGLDAEVRIGAGIQTRGIPLLIGHTRDEFALFTLTNEAFEQFDDDALLVAAAPQFGGRTAEGIDRYRAARGARGEPTDAASVYTAIMTDSMFRIPAIKTAEAQGRHTPEVWSYRFDYPSPAYDGKLGACHSLDIPFIWGTYEAGNMRRFCGEGPHVAELSETMMNTWLAFAKTGNPNWEGLPDWPTYSADERAVMSLGLEPAIDYAPGEAERVFWADLEQERSTLDRTPIPLSRSG